MDKIKFLKSSLCMKYPYAGLLFDEELYGMAFMAICTSAGTRYDGIVRRVALGSCMGYFTCRLLSKKEDIDSDLALVRQTLRFSRRGNKK